MTPCIHRGEIWRHAISKLCGSRGQQVPVYRCGLHVICTHRPYSHNQAEIVCLRCEDYQPTTQEGEAFNEQGGNKKNN